MSATSTGVGTVAGHKTDYEFEPEPAEILDRLLPSWLEAETAGPPCWSPPRPSTPPASVLMKAATDNADELIKNLRRIMNRARQDAITTEIMEIVGGAEALRQECRGSRTGPRTTKSSNRPRSRPDHQEQPNEQHNRRGRRPLGRPVRVGVVAIAGPVVDVEFPPGQPARDQLRRPAGDGGRRRGHHHHGRGGPADRRRPCALHLHEAHRRSPAGHVGGGAPGRGITVPVGDATLGHVFNVDRALPRHRPRSGLPTTTGRSTDRPPLSTPWSRGPLCSRPGLRSSISSSLTCRAARSACSAEPVWARPSLIQEMIRRVAEKHGGVSVFAGVGAAHPRRGTTCWLEMTESGVIEKTAVVFGQMDEPPGVRLRVALSALTMAEYFREMSRIRMCSLFVDNIFRFVQAGSEVSTLLGRMPSAVGYQPTLATRWVSSRSASPRRRDVRSPPSRLCMCSANDYTDPAPFTTFTHLDATTLSRPSCYLSPGYLPGGGPALFHVDRAGARGVGDRHTAWPAESRKSCSVSASCRTSSPSSASTS